MLWSFVNIFHRRAEQVGRQLDDNEQRQRRSQAEQDGTEMRSVELERLIGLGLALRSGETPSSTPATRRRSMRPHRLRLAPPLRLHGEPPDDDGGDDRLQGFHRSKAPGRG